MGHEVIVANARKLKLITENNQKSDKVDARLLSQLGCMNVDWLHPVYQRSQERKTRKSSTSNRGTVLNLFRRLLRLGAFVRRSIISRQVAKIR